MPVKLEHLTEPTEADLIDLGKIRDETAPTGLNLDTDIKSWTTSERWVIGGRFNDRIVGALLAEREGKRIHLSGAGVRTITQRRGVMHQMLHFLCRWADKESLTLVINDSKDSLSESVLRRKFEREGNYLVYNAAQKD